ncbi:Uncharacterised protein [uncultured archaeon]|nr:Uncharacterised protein [uncultured archaeon]
MMWPGREAAPRLGFVRLCLDFASVYSGATSGSRICSLAGLGLVTHLFGEALIFDPGYSCFFVNASQEFDIRQLHYSRYLVKWNNKLA